MHAAHVRKVMVGEARSQLDNAAAKLTALMSLNVETIKGELALPLGVVRYNSGLADGGMAYVNRVILDFHGPDDRLEEFVSAATEVLALVGLIRPIASVLKGASHHGHA